MDIIASMLAYLMGVATIIGALAVSAFVVLAPLDRPAVPVPTASTATKTAITKVSAAKPGANSTSKAAAAVVAPAAASPTTTAAADKRADAGHPRAAPKTKVSQRQLDRRWAQQDERARRWAYQQDPDFEARFLGHTD